jgi:ABC-type glycerol-3-phosphate transport system substrate-binding protein
VLHWPGVPKLKRILWVFIGFALIIWTGLAWFIHSLIGWGGSVANNNVDVLTPSPEAVEWLSWLTMFGTGVAEWIVVGVWGFGVILALVLGFAGSRLLPGLAKLGQSIGTPQ